MGLRLRRGVLGKGFEGNVGGGVVVGRDSLEEEGLCFSCGACLFGRDGLGGFGWGGGEVR